MLEREVPESRGELTFLFSRLQMSLSLLFNIFFLICASTPWKTFSFFHPIFEDQLIPCPAQACEQQGLWQQVLQLLAEVQPDVTLYDLAIKACERGWDG